MVKFSQLHVSGWRQFGQIDIEVHPRLTVLTGANGAGKSTLLGIFSRHLGYHRPLLATPQQSSSGKISFFSGVFKSLTSWVRPPEDSNTYIGSISYGSHRARLFIPARPSVQFEVGIESSQSVDGFHVGSHRSHYTYQRVGEIPTEAITPAKAFANFDSELRNEFTEGRWNSSPIFHMKKALLAMAMFGEGNSTVRANLSLKQAYEGFIQKLSEFLPRDIGFLGVEIRMPDVVIRTRTGEFLLDASSGGLMALIDLAWRIYMFSLNHEEFVVTMDEPENHLHPSMQRALLPSLLKVFPKVQFIVATHSPFMVSSVRDSNVYALRFVNNEGAVEAYSGASLPIASSVVSVKLDSTNKAGDASAILREVLGMPTTLPDWISEDLQELADRYGKQEFSTSTLSELRKELSKRGMSEFYPDVIAKVAPK